MNHYDQINLQTNAMTKDKHHCKITVGPYPLKKYNCKDFQGRN